MNLRKDWVFFFHIVLVGLSLSAFISQFIMGWLDLRYFTDQSNLGVLVWLLCAVFCHKNVNLSQKLKGVFRGAVTLYLTFTFLIFSTLLYDGTMTYSSLIFHYLLPIVFLFEWVLTESDKQYQWRYVGAWIIYPLVYLVWVVINGNLTGFYPYFFFDLPRLVVGPFVIYVILLVVLFFVLGLVFVGINRAIFKHRMKTGKPPA